MVVISCTCVYTDKEIKDEEWVVMREMETEVRWR